MTMNKQLKTYQDLKDKITDMELFLSETERYEKIVSSVQRHHLPLQ